MPSPQKPKKPNETFEFFRTVFYAVLLALVFRSCAYEPFHIPSGSMKSTLLIGDYLFVSKLSYGYSRYSFPLGIDFFDGRILGDAPKRGDIVVFRPPGEPHTDYIKRLIGLPGDRVQVKGGVLYVNGEMAKQSPLPDFTDTDSSPPKPLRRYMETLPGGRQHTILDETPYGEVDNTPEYTVPEKHYFFMGDNRDNSRDSRYMDGPVGFVPEENLIGRAVVIAFSIDTRAAWWHVWTWPSSLRWERFFTLLGDQ